MYPIGIPLSSTNHQDGVPPSSHFQARREASKKGGRKSLDPILKRTKPTRPPKKIKTPQFWATSKWKLKNL